MVDSLNNNTFGDPILVAKQDQDEAVPDHNEMRINEEIKQPEGTQNNIQAALACIISEEQKDLQ